MELAVGDPVGKGVPPITVGTWVGVPDGVLVGLAVGDPVGTVVEAAEGAAVGAVVGMAGLPATTTSHKLRDCVVFWMPMNTY